MSTGLAVYTSSRDVIVDHVSMEPLVSITGRSTSARVHSSSTAPSVSSVSPSTLMSLSINPFNTILPLSDTVPLPLQPILGFAGHVKFRCTIRFP